MPVVTGLMKRGYCCTVNGCATDFSRGIIASNNYKLLQGTNCCIRWRVKVQISWLCGTEFWKQLKCISTRNAICWEYSREEIDKPLPRKYCRVAVGCTRHSCYEISQRRLAAFFAVARQLSLYYKCRQLTGIFCLISSTSLLQTTFSLSGVCLA